MLAVIFAVLAAAANATASVLQRKAARDEPEDRAFSIGLLWDLVRRPVWVAGVCTVLLGFFLHAFAVSEGPLTLVQPLLVMELPFTLLLASWLLGGRLRSQEWGTVIAMAVGVAVLLFALRPHGGDPRALTLTGWIIGLAATLGLASVLLVWGRRSRGAARSALLGVAAGITFGLTAVLVKAATAAFSHGLPTMLTAWQTYLILVTGPSAFFLLQNALQAGSLVACQPAMTLANPITAIIWGVALFGERVRGGAWIALALAGLALTAAGAILLARSPLFAQNTNESDHARAHPRRTGPIVPDTRADSR